MYKNGYVSPCAKYNGAEWIGKKFNMLTVTDIVHVEKNFGKEWFWKAKCDCGKEAIVVPGKVVKGLHKSCGCLRNGPAWNKRHGESHTHLHNIWCGMNNRCNPKHKNSEEYGKRGITVCDEWKSYEAFAKWARENGYSDGLTIERIDVDGNYCPENCTWIPLAKQARNRRTTAWVTYNGRQMSLAEASEIAGLPYKQVWFRIHVAGWTFEKAISTPLGTDLGQKESSHVCVICGKEFTSHSCRSKYCSLPCYRIYKNAMRRKGPINLPSDNTKRSINIEKRVDKSSLV